MNLKKVFKHTLNKTINSKSKEDKKIEREVNKKIIKSAKQGRTKVSTYNKKEVLYITGNYKKFEEAGFKVWWEEITPLEAGMTEYPYHQAFNNIGDKRKLILATISWADQVEAPLPEKEEPLEGSSKEIDKLMEEMLSTEKGRSTHNAIVSAVNGYNYQAFKGEEAIKHISTYELIYKSLGYSVEYQDSPWDSCVIIYANKGDESNDSN